MSCLVDRIFSTAKSEFLNDRIAIELSLFLHFDVNYLKNPAQDHASADAFIATICSQLRGISATPNSSLTW